jgi:hypothetical protein
MTQCNQEVEHHRHHLVLVRILLLLPTLPPLPFHPVSGLRVLAKVGNNGTQGASPVYKILQAYLASWSETNGHYGKSAKTLL